MITALVAVAGIWYVRAAVEATFAENGSAVRQAIPVQKQIEIVIDLRTHLQRYITRAGAMVALATLAKGALRQAILATGGNSAEFPAEYVLLQGAYFTALLALVYIPTYSILAEVGSDLVETIYPVTTGDLDWDHLSRWQANRKSLEGLLQLEGGAVHNLQGQRLDPGAGRDQRHVRAARVEVSTSPSERGALSSTHRLLFVGQALA